MRRDSTIVVMVALMLVTAVRCAAQTQHTNQARGFNPEQVYDAHDIDSVNLLNGNLVLSIPIGQRYKVNGNLSYGLTLHYNSNLWNFEERCPNEIDMGLFYLRTMVHDFDYDESTGKWTLRDIFQSEPDPVPPRLSNPCWTVSYPNPVGTAGLGWQLHFGQLFPPSGNEADLNAVAPLRTEKSLWVYEMPDGSEHSFYPTLHSTDPAGSESVSYTRDGTYLRMKTVGTTREIEFPSGEIHVFSNKGTDASPDWRAIEYKDRFGNWVRFTYDELIWTIDDRQGRHHTITLVKKAPEYRSVISSISLAAFNGQTALYTFEHTVTKINRASPHLEGDTGLKPEIDIPFLTGIVLPDRSRYSMPLNLSDATDSFYDLTGALSSSKIRGVIRKLTVPAGGRIEWDYGTIYSFPMFSSSRGYLRHTTGVKRRRLIVDGKTHEWVYEPDLEDIPATSNVGKSCLVDTESGKPECAPKEFVNKVTTPQGDVTKSYFSVYPHWIVALGLPQPPRQVTDWTVAEYGLPFTKKQQMIDSWGRPVFLSQQTFKAGTGELVRSVYVRYESDLPQLSDGFGSVRDLNRRLVASRILYNDDNDGGVKFADMFHDDFDGLGHYRVTHQSGNFESSSGTAAQRGKVGDLRIDIVKYNPNRGTYAVDIASGTTAVNHTYTPVPENEPWVLDTYDRVVSGDYNKRSTSYFDFGATGLLRRKRVLSELEIANSLTQLRTNDVVVEYSYDLNGNRTGEAFYGGDKKNNLPTSGELKDITLPPGPEYTLIHVFQHGSLQRTQYAGVSFNSVDNDIDPSTGLVKVSRDVARDPTTYVYDAMGRVTQTTTREGTVTQVVYTPKDQRLPNNEIAVAPIVNVLRKSGTSTISEEIYQFDGLGRLTFEQRQIPNGTVDGMFIARAREYNAMGWLTAISEWGRPGARTEYSAFDPFGRAHLITPPDGAGHVVGLRYIGDRKVRRTLKIGTSFTGTAVAETEAVTTELYDRLGRLRSVIEPSGPGGGDATTSYEHDLNGRLIKAITSQPVSNSTPLTQTREFAYDNRGFLLSEKLPEVGLFGNGTIAYGGYDTMGHAGTKTEFTDVLQMTYDSAGRLTQVDELLAKGGGLRALKSLAYYTTNGTAGTNNFRLGKLQRATRHNWVTHPISGATIDVVVHDDYIYAGRDGRVSKHTTTLNATGTNAPTFEQTYVYDALGNILSRTYPKCINANCANSSNSSRALTLNYAYNQGILTGVSGNGNVYAGNISYHPNGAVNTVTHGNGVATVFGLDPNHIQRPSSVSTTGVFGGLNWSSGLYKYDGAGNVTRIGSDWYVYDKVNRLVEGTALGEAVTPLAQRRKQTYSYDTFANLREVKTFGNVTPTSGTLTEQSSLSVDTGTNRRTDLKYDVRGNVQGRLNETPSPYSYDALNMMKTAPGKTFIYNSGDERLWTIDHGSSTWVETYTLRGLGNEVLREYQVVGGDALHSWSWTRDYIYRGSQLLAADTPSSRLFYHVDHLGTPRLITDVSKRRIYFRQYFPFGGEAVASGQDGGRLRFTGHERDAHFNGDTLDYMHARTYNPNWGRFLSIDPGRDITPKNPQSWNLYTYVRNNPVGASDPTGRALIGMGVGAGGVGRHGELGGSGPVRWAEGPSEPAWPPPVLPIDLEYREYKRQREINKRLCDACLSQVAQQWWRDDRNVPEVSWDDVTSISGLLRSLGEGAATATTVAVIKQKGTEVIFTRAMLADLGLGLGAGTGVFLLAEGYYRLAWAGPRATAERERDQRARAARDVCGATIPGCGEPKGFVIDLSDFKPGGGRQP